MRVPTLKNLIHVIHIVIGMLGIRPEMAKHKAIFSITLVAWVVCTAWFLMTFRGVFGLPPASLKTIALVYAAAAWLFYYVGNSVVLGTQIRAKWIERFGEERALAMYNGLVGVAFANQAYAHGAINAAYGGTAEFAMPQVWIVAGMAMMAFGTVIKIWSTSVTSLDTYYYNDMFLDRPVKACPDYVVRGPYRWFRSPMYGIGNIPAYGAALMALSWQGLVLAAAFQASIYAFDIIVERPFVRRVYVKNS